MENEKTLEELKQQYTQQLGCTEEQLDRLLAAISKLWEAVREFLNRAAPAFQEFAEAIAAAAQRSERELVQEYVGSPDLAAVADDFAQAFKRLQEEIAGIYISTPPTYDRTDTRNAQYNARLKGYKSKYMRSAAIRAPRRIARSCC